MPCPAHNALFKQTVKAAAVEEVIRKKLEEQLNYNLEGKIFASVSNTENGEVNEDTLFYYHQEGNTVWAEYEGGAIIKGHILAKIIEDGKLDMRYHHLNTKGKIVVGTCISTPVESADGHFKFQEEWQCLAGDNSSGYSEIIEIDSV